MNGTATALEIGRTLLCGWSDGRVDAQARTHVPGVEFAPTLESIVAEQPMLSILERAFGVTTWEEAQERVSAADATRELVDARAVLSTAVANLNHIFHPEAILLISRFPLIAQVLGSAAEEAVPGVRVISSVYDPVEACYGATDLVFQSFFGLNELTR